MSNVTLSVLVPVCGPCGRREVQRTGEGGERGGVSEKNRKNRSMSLYVYMSAHCVYNQ